MIFGFGGEDEINGGLGNDYLYGGADNDTLIGGAGDDHMWGGDRDSRGLGDGTDTVDYSSVKAAISVQIQGTGTDPKLIVNDGENGTDTLRSIEKLIATEKQDSLTINGNVAATIDLTNKHEGFSLVTQGNTQLRIRSFEIFEGGDAKTTFIGNYEISTFIAGSGGGDFTLTGGDTAVGYEGVIDIFRVSTKPPTGLIEAAAITWLTNNKASIFNFGDEDKLYVDGVLFTGNTVTSTIGPFRGSSYNTGEYIAQADVRLAGSSSYNVHYPQPVFVQEGIDSAGNPYGYYTYADGTIRDVRYELADGSGAGLITFAARDVVGSSYGDYTLAALKSTDELLTIVINGFTDGEGGISFAEDPLANAVRPTNIALEHLFPSRPAEDHDGGDLPVFDELTGQARLDEEYDQDGTPDGLVAAGGTPITSDDFRFNRGEWTFYDGFNSEAFISPPRIVMGTSEDETIVGSWADDQLSGGDGSDVLEGHAGDDLLDGGNGVDSLYGGSGDDTLIGGADLDLLDGGSGNDVMGGGLGNDYYVVDSDEDIVVELAGEGIDWVITELNSYTLPDNVENLGYMGWDGLTGIGNALNNELRGSEGSDTLVGNGGDDWIEAGGGSDTLNGGSGNDRFVFFGSGDDIIEDFTSGSDKIDLSAYGIAANNVAASAIAGGTLLSVDSNEDGTADFTIFLAGSASPASTDYIF